MADWQMLTYWVRFLPLKASSISWIALLDQMALAFGNISPRKGHSHELINVADLTVKESGFRLKGKILHSLVQNTMDLCWMITPMIQPSYLQRYFPASKTPFPRASATCMPMECRPGTWWRLCAPFVKSLGPGKPQLIWLQPDSPAATEGNCSWVLLQAFWPSTLKRWSSLQRTFVQPTSVKPQSAY